MGERLTTTQAKARYGGGFPGASPDNRILKTTQNILDALFDYVGRHLISDDLEDPNWGFIAPKGATATFETGQGALKFPEKLAALNCQWTGTSDQGFAQFSIAF